MTIDPSLIERIYEAAVLPGLWPAVLDAIADRFDTISATLIVHEAQGVTVMATPRIRRIAEDYIAEGWADDPTYAAPLFTEQYPGFRTSTDLRTVEEHESLPVYKEFLAPRGLIAGAGTVLQGAHDDLLHVAVDGFPSHAAARAAIPDLDRLRAPLGRALSLTARLNAAAAGATVRALDLAGVGAAVVGRDGWLHAANDRFATRLGNRIDTTRGRLRLADRFAQATLDTALVGMGEDAPLRSIAVMGTDEEAPVALHLLPLRREARDVFAADGILILLAEPANASVPGADLLRLLFDLTPAEARLTRLLVEGHAPADAARRLNIREMTVRTHLRHIFAKTGVKRQTDLIRLLLGVGAPN